MKRRINVFETANGWLVIEGEAKLSDNIMDCQHRCWTFNSLDKAISQIRKVMKAWHQTEPADSTLHTKG